MSAPDKEMIRKLFVRTCKDSGFQLDTVMAAMLVAKVVGCSPLEVWTAMPSMATMQEIAAGTHPAALQATPPSDASS